MGVFKDFAGQRFGRLVALSPAAQDGQERCGIVPAIAAALSGYGPIRSQAAIPSRVAATVEGEGDTVIAFVAAVVGHRPNMNRGGR